MEPAPPAPTVGPPAAGGTAAGGAAAGGAAVGGAAAGGAFPLARLVEARSRLTDDQRTAVTAPPGPLWIEAGAGAGKTSVLTVRVAHRVATGSATAEHTLVCTFTRRAAAELAARLAALGVPAGPPPVPGSPGAGAQVATLHRVALHLVRRHALDRGRAVPVVGDRLRHLVRAVPEERRDVVAAEIAWARSRALRPTAYAEAAEQAGRSPGLPLDTVADHFAAYDRSLSRSGALDVDDLVVRAGDLLEDDRAFADAVRWRYRHLFVDELQDVTPAQFRLVVTLLGPAQDLTAVGDPNQSIYGWNGADATLVRSLDEHLAGLTVVRLDDNHRSTPQIVAAANAVLGSALVGRPRSRRSPGARPTLGAWHDEQAEAEGVAATLLAWATERPWGDLCVLARTNEQLTMVEQVLRRSGVPVRRAGDEQRDQRDAVDLTTFHQAKGLEWWGACVVGLEDGLVPIARCTSEDQRAEERRLLYVALTRATDRVACSWAHSRRLPGRGQRRQRPSPWLAALEPHCDPPASLDVTRTTTGGSPPPASADTLRPSSRVAALRAILDGDATPAVDGALDVLGQGRTTSM